MTTLSRRVRILPDGSAEVRVGKVELGQGILTALRQLAADELDLALDRIHMLPAHTEHGPDEGLTAGSMSIAKAGPALRLACANVRALFLAEAARRWDVDVTALEVRDGCVRLGSRRLSYGELVDAVDLDVEARDVPLKQVLCVAGTDAPRLDLPDKIAGRPRFLTDLRPPGLMHGRVIRPPGPDPQVPPGVILVRDSSFLGVVGENEAEVERAAAQLRGSCVEQGQVSLREGPHEMIEVIDENPLPGTGLRATYSRPYLAHASIAPSCGMARWEPDGRLSVWSHSQGIHRLRDAIAAALNLDAVSVQHVENAGSYGHNGADDAAFDAVLLARAVPTRPVLVTWTRQDELTCSPYGPAMTADVTAVLDDTGRIRSWTYDVWSQGHVARPGYAGTPGLLATYDLGLTRAPAADPPQPDGGTTRNAVPPYEVGPRRITGHRLTRSPVRTSSLRSLGAYMNVFATESFLDDVAGAAGRDPLELRLIHLLDPRARKTLRTAAAAGRWGTCTPDNVGRGIAFARYKDTGAYCAVVAEVEADHDIQVRRLTIAVDVGHIVNPDGVRNQIEGGATQSTSWTLKEQARPGFSVDWETYPILRFTEAPEIHVELIPSTAPSVGAGEAAQGPTAAAIANAVTDAIGVRVRDLPLTPEAVLTAIESTR
jgi:nicotinate dehydrogenase subunit B